MILDDKKFTGVVKRKLTKAVEIVEKTIDNRTQKKRLDEILGKAFCYTLCATVFLFPLFFLPLTSETLELNKQLLLFTATFVLAVLAITKSITSERIPLVWSPAFTSIGILVLTWLASSIFSLYPYNSFLGLEKQEFLSFSTLLSLALLSYILVSHFPKINIPHVLLSLFVSSTLVMIIGLLHLFGFFLLPWDFTKTNAFNTIGLTTVWGSFIATLLVVAMVYLLRISLSREKQRQGLSIFLSLYIALSLAALILIDDWRLWAALIIGIAVTLIFLYFKLPKDQPTLWLILPSFIMVLSLTLLFFNPPRLVSLPLSAQPSLPASAQIAFNTILSWPVTGSGPGSFLSSYTKFRPVEINNANLLNLWSVQFDQSSSSLLTAIAATGILGLLALLLLIFFVGQQMTRFLQKEHMSEDYLLVLGLGMGLVTLAVALILNPATITTVFLAWLLLALLLLLLPHSSSILKGGGNSNRFLILSSLVLYSIVALGLIGGFFAIKRYGADLAFAKSLSLDQKLSRLQRDGKQIDQKQIEELISLLQLTIEANPSHHSYHRVLSQALLFKINSLLQNQQHAEQNISLVQTTTVSAIDAAKKAVEISPADVRNTQNLASAYQAIAPITSGADAFAKEHYKKSIELDPQNPLLRQEFGRLYIDIAALKLRSADIAKDDAIKSTATTEADAALAEAERLLKEAVKLKYDYAQSHLYLATIYAQQNKKNEALRHLDEAYQYNSDHIRFRAADETLFYLIGINYASLNQKEKALASYQQAIIMRPDYQLARWQYGLVLADLGRKNEAIQMFESILQLDPNNEVVTKKINELKTGTSSQKESTENSEPTQ